MSNRIEIRGVIVPSEYDTDWMAGYIERGLVTPESAFRRQLGEADPNTPLDVYVNSPGGSVFSGNEMINAVRDWKVENSQPVNVTVGAMAASMGAAFTISAADSVKVHSNAKMMFHGAWGGAVGGAEAMADYSDLLNQINADIKTTLLSRYDLAPETVDEWFAEGREGWLSADQMVEVGIAQEIVGEDAEAVQFAPSEIAGLSSHGLDIAALADEAGIVAEVEPEAPETDPEPELEEETEDDGEQPDTDAPVDESDEQDDPESADDDADDPTDPDEEYEPEPSDAVKAAIRTEALIDVAEQIEGLNAGIAKRDELIAKLQSERDTARADNYRLTETISNTEARLKTLLSGSLTFTPVAETKEEKDRVKATEPKRDDPKPRPAPKNHSRAFSAR